MFAQRKSVDARWERRHCTAEVPLAVACRARLPHHGIGVGVDNLHGHLVGVAHRAGGEANLFPRRKRIGQIELEARERGRLWRMLLIAT